MAMDPAISLGSMFDILQPLLMGQNPELCPRPGYLPTIETEGESNNLMEELFPRLLSSLGFSSGARWLWAVRKHRQTSRVARNRRVTSILGGLNGKGKAVGVVARECALLLSWFLWDGALTP